VNRLRPGEWLAAAAGVVLIVSLFMADEFGVIGIVLVLVALVAFALFVLQATRISPALPVAFGVLTVTAGSIGTLLAVVLVIGDGGDGAWLSLAAVVALTIGGWLSIRDERVRGLPAQPEPELRPGPGRGAPPRPGSELSGES
jgi:hypothetical protein